MDRLKKYPFKSNVHKCLNIFSSGQIEKYPFKANDHKCSQAKVKANVKAKVKGKVKPKSLQNSKNLIDNEHSEEKTL